MNNRASLQLGGDNWAAKDANLLAYKTSLSEKNFLPIEFDFTRGSNLAATRVDENGLIEKGRENLLTQSNQFDTTWLVADGTITSGESGYDGSSDAWLLEATSAYTRMTKSVSSSGVQTYSVYAKANTTDFLLLRCNIGGNQYAIFNLSDGTIPTLYAGFISGNATSVGNGWYRVSLLFNGSLSEVAIGVSTDGTIAGWGDTANESIYIQDAQLEQGLVATDYIETGATTAQAGVLEDLPRINYSGSTPSLLLEPSRTNLIPNSEYANGGSVSSATITDNVTISPEGVQNAARFVPTPGFGRWESATFGGSITNGTTYVTSMYFNTGSTLDIVTFYIGWDGATGSERIGIKFNPSTRAYISTFAFGSATLTDYNISEADSNGWYRVSLIAPATNPNVATQIVVRDLNNIANNSDFVDFYGWQMEQGSYPTSYIPTYGTAATRGEDVFQNSTNDTPLGAIGQGTWFVELQKLGDDTNQALYLAPTSNNTEQIRLHFDGANARFRDARNSYLTIGTGVNIKTSMTKMAVSIDTTSGIAKAYANGSQLGSNYTLQANTFEFSRIVADGKGFILKQSLFFPTALSDAELATLTT